MEYTEFSVNGQPSIGMMPMPPQVPAEVPSYWMPYFQTANVDESAAKAKTLGATVVVPPSDIPDAGRFSVLNDPQGAMFAIFTPKPRA
jgi:predicted enzyme related to lactoylglutathione lyase